MESWWGSVNPEKKRTEPNQNCLETSPWQMWVGRCFPSTGEQTVNIHGWKWLNRPVHIEGILTRCRRMCGTHPSTDGDTSRCKEKFKRDSGSLAGPSKRLWISSTQSDPVCLGMVPCSCQYTWIDIPLLWWTVCESQDEAVELWLVHVPNWTISRLSTVSSPFPDSVQPNTRPTEDKTASGISTKEHRDPAATEGLCRWPDPHCKEWTRLRGTATSSGDFPQLDPNNEGQALQMQKSSHEEDTVG